MHLREDFSGIPKRGSLDEIFNAQLEIRLACVWFGDEMGGYIGPTSSGAITNTTPGWLVCIAGWLLLLMPVFVGIVFAIWG